MTRPLIYTGFANLPVIDFRAETLRKYSTKADEAFLCGDDDRFARNIDAMLQHFDALAVEMAEVRAAREATQIKEAA